MIDLSYRQNETPEPRWYGVFPAKSNDNSLFEAADRCCSAIPYRSEAEVPLDSAVKALCTLWPGVLFHVVTLEPSHYNLRLKKTFLRIDSIRLLANYRDGERVEKDELAK